MSLPSILAIDIGSSSVRAGLYDHEARPLSRLSVRRAWSFDHTSDGGSTMDPSSAVEIVFSAIDELLTKAARRDLEITHVALCSFWHSLMGVDSKGKPTTPVLGWADTRSGRFSEILKKRFKESDVHDRTGAHFHSSFWPAKLLWIRKGSPDAFDATHTWMGFGDYVALQLTGRVVTSISMGSATGIFDQRRCDWDNELLRYLKVRRDHLPEVAASDAHFPSSRSVAKRWPQLGDAQLLPAIGDGAADHVGSCGIGEGRASLMVGTSAAMRVAYEGEPPEHVPAGLWCYRIDEQRVILGGALSDGGNLYEWCTQNLKLPAGVEECIRERTPAGHGVNVLPFFHGERSTGYRGQINGEIIGLRAENDNVDILQASMEAIGYRLAAFYDRLGKVSRIRTIVASGGALNNSSIWPRMIADILGGQITLSTAQESASRGTVLLALESLGKIDSIAGLEFPESPTLAFDPARHAAYKKGRARHEEALSKAYGTEK